MTARVPQVLVSSTFYDLKQIRADLRAFIENGLGYKALIAEHSSFPVDPDVTAIENCRLRVERDADVLLLVIGARYGSIDATTTKSVTNLEYLAARAKGIPIYAFVERRVLYYLEVWSRDRTASLAGIIDTPQLMEFVEQVRSRDAVWTLEFETAQDIVDGLRAQFAYLMNDGLNLLRRTRSQSPGELAGLSGRSFRVAMEKPEAWEYLLFAAVLEQEVESARDLRERHRLGITAGRGERVAGRAGVRWILDRGTELTRLADIVQVAHGELQAALGPAGQPGNVQQIVTVARRLGLVYRETLELSEVLRRAHYDEQLAEPGRMAADAGRDMIEQIECAGPKFRAATEYVLAHPNDGPHSVGITMTLDIDPRFAELVEEALRVYQDDPTQW